MSAGAAHVLTPWTNVVEPHDDVQSGDLAMGTFAANLAAVASHDVDLAEVYGDPHAFFAASYLTPGMLGVLRDVNKVLCGERGDRALQLRTPFGGGKTHSLIALYHLATARDRAVAGAGGQLDELPDPGVVNVAVLSGERLDPARPREVDGLQISTLWGELAYQLGGRDAYEALLVDSEEGPPPSGDRLVPLLREAGPALILLDELLVYLVKGKAIARGDTTVGQLGLVFVQNLSEAVNQVAKTVMVYSLQASVGEAAQDEGMLDALEKVTSRIDARREPVSGDDVLHVVQRRLFKSAGDPAVAREVAAGYAEGIEAERLAHAEDDTARREAREAATTLRERVEDSYPFHPALIDLMYERWGSLPSYQRTRGALQFLATVVHALWQSGTGVQPLIGPGDVRLDDEAVRSSFFEQVGEANAYSAVVQADFLGADAGTRIVDERVGKNAPALGALRVGTRVATAIALLSFGGSSKERGALEREIVEATLAPGLDGNVIRAALGDLRRETLLYLHHTGSRYRFETTPNLNKLINDEEQALESEEVLAEVRARLERAIGDAGGSQVAVWPDGPGAIPDGLSVFVCAYLPLGHDTSQAALAALVKSAGSSNRKHKNGLALLLPTATSGDAARAGARTTLALDALLRRATAHQFSAEQKAELKQRLTDAGRTLDTQAGQLYERILLPAGADGPDGVRFEEVGLGTVPAAGRSLQERVREALGQYVFDTLKAKRLVSLLRLGEVAAVGGETVVESFFSYYEFTKLWSVAPLEAAVAEGVRAGDLGYVPHADEGPDGNLTVSDPTLVKFQTEVAADEIDLGPQSRLLSPAEARRLGKVAEPEPEPVDPEPDPVLPPDPMPRPEGKTSVTLKIHATEDDLHTINQALVNLRGLLGEGGTMRLDLDARATSTAGPIDEPRFRNAVRELLEEDPDVSFEEEWG